jgi:hypothetical protein
MGTQQIPRIMPSEDRSVKDKFARSTIKIIDNDDCPTSKEKAAEPTAVFRHRRSTGAS